MAEESSARLPLRGVETDGGAEVNPRESLIRPV